MRQVRRKYVRPTLIRYGSLRNLTGGSGSRGRDGAVQRTRF
ncbi:MAG: lasso RiPP family leader peptide-containing protein [Erythrobacter sp.]